MTRFLRPALLASVLLIAACGGDGKIDNDLRLRVIQAMPDAPLLEYRLDNSVQDGLTYRAGTRFLTLTPATYGVVINAILPDGERLSLFDEALPLVAGIDYTLVAIGRMADGDPVVHRTENPLTAVTTGYARLQFLHAAPDGPSVDVYLTEPDAALAASTPLATLAFGEDLQRQEFLAGSRRLRLTGVGDPGDLLFDSGSIPLRSSDDLLMIIAVNVDAGPSPFVLAVNTGASTTSLRDTRSTAEARVIHVSPDTPPIDVVAKRTIDENSVDTVPLADALPYAGATDYVGLTPGIHAIEATRDGDTEKLFEFSQALGGGQRISIYAVSLLQQIRQNVIIDDNRPVATAGSLLIYHASLAAGTIDVYIEESGTDIAGELPFIPGLASGAPTPRLEIMPGDYTLTLTAAGTKTPVGDAIDIPLQAGRVFTAIVRDAPRLVAGDEGKPVGVILIDEAPP